MAAIDEYATRFLWVAHAMIVAGLIAVLVMAAEREPPFRMLDAEPVHVDKGETAVFRVPVVRDIKRRCSAEFTRYLFAADGARYDLGTGIATADMIDALERRSPGHLVIAVNIPPTIVSGPATLTTELSYFCNKVHAFWPIHLSTSIPFVVR